MVDLVSDILKTVSVKNRVTGLLRLRGDWAFESPAADEAVFHLIFKGSVWITFQEQPVQLNEGDMILFTKGHGHLLASSRGAPVVSFEENDTRVRVHSVNDGVVSSVDKRANGPETSIICARFNFDSRSGDELVSGFPDRAVLRRSHDDSFAMLEPILRAAANAAHCDEPGALAELDGLVNILYLSFMRRWLKHSLDREIGWIRAMHDPQIAKAVHLIHSEPTKRWSVLQLASEVAMSRSSFAGRFSEAMGEPPLRYLTRWRMFLAAQQLESDPSRTIASIAVSVGYNSEATFSSTFKRAYGKSPSVWRREAGLNS